MRRAAMNYYEELSLSRSATTEEIRQAYRNLARLLHPDQQQDEKLRQLAENQMKRLNEIVAVLTDPERRRSYDASLESGRGAFPTNPPISIVVVAAPPVIGEQFPFWQVLGRNRVWLLIAAIGLGSIFWYVAEDMERGPARHSEPAVRATVAAPGAATRQEQSARVSTSSEPVRRALENRALRSPRPRSRAVEAESERSAAPRELKEFRPGEAGPFSSAPVSDLPQEPPPGRSVEQRTAPQQQAATPDSAPALQKPPPHSGFAGSWFYASARRDSLSENSYPPEYIEMIITEEAGVLGGRYRARYRVADRAISPVVVFQFEGRASQDSTQLQWSGSDAKGEGQLKLLSRDSMEVTWWATDLGKGMGLASGTAVLIRRHEP